VSLMTLPERVSQLMTNNAPAIPRLGLQQYTYWSEGLHGVNRLGANIDYGSATTVGVQATSFPSNFATAMSWDPELIYAETTAISDEIRGFLDKSLWGTGQNNLGPSASDYGCLTYFAPNVNMDRDPRWGRTNEAFGEDPHLVATMAGAFVNGFQGQSITGQQLTPYLKAAATAKHYALNNEDDDRNSASSNTTDANIRDFYTRQFASLVENAHVAGVMTAYNAVNGTPCPANTYTVNELLQATYGFRGYTTSDAGAIGDIYGLTDHDWAAPGWTTDGTTWTNTSTGVQISAAAGAQAFALRAGTELNLTGPEMTPQNIEAAISLGLLSEGVVDAALTRVLTIRMATGEFDPPNEVAYTQITKAVIQSSANQALAEQVATQNIVLLQNNDVTGTSSTLLPVDPSGLSSVAIVGNLANTLTLGGYSGDPTLQVTAVAGITAALPSATITYDACDTSTTTTTPAVISAATQAAITSADLVIVFVGSDLNVAAEGHDRTTLAMPGNYDSLIAQVAAIGNPKTVLVMQADGPYDIEDAQPEFPAIVFSGYNGESQGAALAQVLFGQVNPAGHLNFTWYANDDQLPAMDNYGLTPSQTGGLGRTYMYFTGQPTYPFGYGLSYTTFGFANIAVGPPAATPDHQVRVSFDVTNTGTVAGATVAQLYVAPQFTVPGVELPLQQLEGFKKTAVLAPGQTEHVTLTVDIASLSEWDETNLNQVVYEGPYEFRVGPDSATIAGSGTVNVGGQLTPRVRSVLVQPDQLLLNAGDTLSLAGQNPWITPDTNAALEQPHAPATGIIEAVNSDQSFVDLSQARVSFHSRDSSVATVDDNGTITGVKDGVTTISVRVDGVEGTMPIVVQGTVTDSTPVVMAVGQPATASATFTNGGTRTVRNVSLTATVPTGWTITPVTPVTDADVPGGSTITATWQITPPATATPGPYPVTYAATSNEGSFSDQSQTNVPYASVTAAYNNSGITDDNTAAAGSFDGGGRNFSAQALATAGFTAGQSVTVDGITFAWPGVNVPDNIVCTGQAVPVTGTGSTLGFLGAGDNGTGSGVGTLVYTDGTTQQFTLGFADWWAASAIAGTSIAASCAYYDDGANSAIQNRTVHLYYTSFTLSAGKTVAYVVLPQVTEDTNIENLTALHVFAISAG
jgi:beta-glucosidase